MADLQAGTVAATFSRGIARLPGLASALGVTAMTRARRLAAAELVVGWGLKANTKRARRYADRHGLPYVTVEDGFLRSVDLGVKGARPYGIVMDDIGIYYDARRPSRLEQMLNGMPVAPLPGGGDPINQSAVLSDPTLISRARRCIDAIVGNGLSKYNFSPDQTLPPCSRSRVLVIDQTAGDLSIHHGLADASTFTDMLQAARRENPDAQILIKTHPDVIRGRKHGHFRLADTDERTELLTTDINPIRLLQQVDKVYVVTSQFGFEALMVGLPVVCFGAPFYAGWGLTDDRRPVARRRKQRSMEELFAAAYLLYSRYIDPDTGERCAIERVIDHLALQRRQFARNTGVWLGFGISWWKRWWVRQYLRSPGNTVKFYRHAAALPAGLDRENTRVLVWGIRDNTRLRSRAAALGYPVFRMEDGFLRSVGLGTDLTTPMSVVIDSRGIYFDPNTPSDLEDLLTRHQFTADEQNRASALLDQLLQMRLSKYNFHGPRPTLTLDAKPGQRIILVPGQVEGDAAIRMGCPDIDTNAQLLARVRQQCPDAYILYKPHPDVVSGNRRADKISPDPRHFDQQVHQADIDTCLNRADEVHTLTSLVGFEALLRNKTVVTYGVPFYAGWGLTQDQIVPARRGRTLTLEQLIAGVLILYPRYLNNTTGEFTTVEHVVQRLGTLLTGSPRQNPGHGLAARSYRTLRAFLVGVGREVIAARHTGSI